MNVQLINHEMEKLALQEKQLQELNKQKNRLLSIYSKGHLVEEEYIKEVQKIDFKIAELHHNTTTEDWVTTITRYLELGKECVTIFENGSFEDKRSLLEEISSNLTWNEENLNVSNDLWLNSFIKSLKTIKSKYPQFEPGKSLDFKGSKDLFGTTCPVVLRLLDNVRTCLLSHKGSRDVWY